MQLLALIPNDPKNDVIIISPTIKWQSKKALVCLRREETTGAPMVRFGTKWWS